MSGEWRALDFFLFNDELGNPGVSMVYGSCISMSMSMDMSMVAS